MNREKLLTSLVLSYSICKTNELHHLYNPEVIALDIESSLSEKGFDLFCMFPKSMTKPSGWKL